MAVLWRIVYSLLMRQMDEFSFAVRGTPSSLTRATRPEREIAPRVASQCSSTVLSTL